jgi:hypothetical protein
MTGKPPLSKERRIAPRKEEALRVDVKVLPQKELEGILEGDGYSDLDSSSLALTRPRMGMKDMLTCDLSASGLGLVGSVALPKGAALALDLHLPGQKTVLKLLGEVMWSDEFQGLPRAGLRVAALDRFSEQRMKNFLNAQ